MKLSTLFLTVFLAFSTILTAQAATEKASVAAATSKMKVVFQLSDIDPSRIKLLMSNLKNFSAAEKGAAIEVIVFGQAVEHFKFDSPYADAVTQVMAETGAKIKLCENSIKGFNLEKKDLMDEVGYVPGGVRAIVQRQMEGWSYIRP